MPLISLGNLRLQLLRSIIWRMKLSTSLRERNHPNLTGTEWSYSARVWLFRIPITSWKSLITSWASTFHFTPSRVHTRVWCKTSRTPNEYSRSSMLSIMILRCSLDTSSYTRILSGLGSLISLKCRIWGPSSKSIRRKYHLKDHPRSWLPELKRIKI